MRCWLDQQAAHTERTSPQIGTCRWQGTPREIADIPAVRGAFRVACDCGALEDCLRGSVAGRATDRYAGLDERVGSHWLSLDTITEGKYSTSTVTLLSSSSSSCTSRSSTEGSEPSPETRTATSSPSTEKRITSSPG